MKQKFAIDDRIETMDGIMFLGMVVSKGARGTVYGFETITRGNDSENHLNVKFDKPIVGGLGRESRDAKIPSNSYKHLKKISAKKFPAPVEIRFGSVIKVKEKDKFVIKELSDKFRALELAIHQAQIDMFQTHTQLFKELEVKYPEIKGWLYSFDYKEQQINILENREVMKRSVDMFYLNNVNQEDIKNHMNEMTKKVAEAAQKVIEMQDKLAGK